MASEHSENTHSHTETSVKESSPIKRYFLYVLIGGLVLSALISIVAVLVGEFNETVGKALTTTLVIVIHALLGLAFLSTGEHKTLSSKLIVNTLFTLVIASLLTAIFGIWDIFTPTLVGDFYGTYFLALVTVLVISALLTAHQQDQTTRAVMWGSVASVSATFLLIVPYFFADDSYVLPEVYGRITWAFVILSSTLAVLTGIFDRLYAVKHPEPKLPPKPGSMPAWLKVLLTLIVVVFCLPFIIPFLALVIGGVTSTGY